MAITPLLFSINLWASSPDVPATAPVKIKKESAKTCNGDPSLTVDDLCAAICDQIWHDVTDPKEAVELAHKFFGHGGCEMVCHCVCDPICDGII